VVNLLDIEIVVIGGGLVSTGELLLAPARDSFRGLVFGCSRRSLPAIVPASFGPDAGVVGAATLALDQTGPHRPAPSGPSRSQSPGQAGLPGEWRPGEARPGRRGAVAGPNLDTVGQRWPTTINAGQDRGPGECRRSANG
jgi:hypothetical protein